MLYLDQYVIKILSEQRNVCLFRKLIKANKFGGIALPAILTISVKGKSFFLQIRVHYAFEIPFLDYRCGTQGASVEMSVNNRSTHIF